MKPLLPVLQTLPEWSPAEVERLLTEQRHDHALATARYLMDVVTDSVAVLRTGRLLRRYWQELPQSARRGSVRICLLGNMVLQPLADVLDALCAAWGLEARIYVSPYNQFQQLIRQEDSRLNQENWDLVLVCVDNALLCGGSAYGMRTEPRKKAAAVRAAAAELENALRLLVRTGATVGLTLFPLPTELGLGPAGNRNPDSPSTLWREVNLSLLQMVAEQPSLYAIDLEALLGDWGKRWYLDPRRHDLGGLALHQTLVVQFGREVMQLVRPLKALQKKVAVVDLDGTLWAGVLGEDGPGGVQVHAGHAYLQELLYGYQQEGTMLALATRNDPDQVAEALAAHPGMILRADQFVRIEASWGPKPEAVRRLAELLNLGLDSFVFLDDNPAERAHMRHALPEVYTPELPQDAAWYASSVARLGLFGGLTVTAEDRVRTRSYQVEIARQQLLGESDSLVTYLSRLNIAVGIAPLDEMSLPRACQLTNKTNQFNMTTVRMTEGQLREWFSASGERSAFCVRVSDRFEDSGLTGLVLTERVGEDLRIRNFLLSCRVLARGVETAVLAFIARQAESAGARGLVGEYRATQRNHVAAEVYRQHGFAPAGQEGETELWRCDLAHSPRTTPAHISLQEI